MAAGLRLQVGVVVATAAMRVKPSQDTCLFSCVHALPMRTLFVCCGCLGRCTFWEGQGRISVSNPFSSFPCAAVLRQVGAASREGFPGT
mgnify:CR=1 FL=1